MKSYKQIDWWTQVLLIPAGVIYSLAVPGDFPYAYFIVGGWQLASCFIHFVLKNKFLAVRGRRRYLITLAILFGLGVVSIPLIFLYGFLLLIASPILAIWYAGICYGEIALLEKKSFIHLK